MKIQRTNFGMDNAFGYEMHEEKYNFHVHLHQFVELTLVLDGELSVTVGAGEKETAKAGEFILIFPFQMHKYSSDRINKFVIYTFSPSLISDYLAFAKGKIGEKAVFKADKSTIDLFVSRLITGEDYSLYSIRSCLYAMLSDFSKQVELKDNKNDNGAIEKMIAYINENYTLPISLDDVAKKIGYSANYLSHCIKKRFSFGYTTLLSCIRIERAKTLLSETKKSSLEISLECGFGSERNFNRQFKNITGMTPKKYKKSNEVTVINKVRMLDYYLKYNGPQFPIKENASLKNDSVKTYKADNK